MRPVRGHIKPGHHAGPPGFSSSAGACRSLRLRWGRADSELEPAFVGELMKSQDPAVLDRVQPPIGEGIAALAADLAVAVAVHRGEHGLHFDVETASGHFGEVGLALPLVEQNDAAIVERLETVDDRVEYAGARAARLDLYRLFHARLRLGPGTCASGEHREDWRHGHGSHGFFLD